MVHGFIKNSVISELVDLIIISCLVEITIISNEWLFLIMIIWEKLLFQLSMND